jgi:hypothetical protein
MPPASADRNQKRRQFAGLTLQLQPNGTLPEQRLDLIKGMDRHCPGLGYPSFACRERIRVAFAANHQIRAVLGDLLNLGGRGDTGHEYLRRNVTRHGRERHCRSMVSTGRGNHAGAGHLSGKKICERAPGLE